MSLHFLYHSHREKKIWLKIRPTFTPPRQTPCYHWVLTFKSKRFTFMSTHLPGRPARSVAAIADLNFRLFNPEQGTAEEQGFYHGFPCHLGHTLRDQKNHWCHDCAKRIKSNVSGLDISFIHSDYRRRLVSILDMVRQTIDDDLDPTACWDVGKSASARYNYPSYRSQTSRRKNDLIMLKKIMYQSFWGDVGKLYVTRDQNVCQTPGCVNPLHLSSTLHMTTYRHNHSFHYFDLDYNPQKLMLMDKSMLYGLSIDEILSKVYRSTIRDPRMLEE